MFSISLEILRYEQRRYEYFNVLTINTRYTFVLQKLKVKRIDKLRYNFCISVKTSIMGRTMKPPLANETLRMKSLESLKACRH